MTRRDAIYEKLGREFKAINERLDAEARTDLDGILWKLSGETAVREPKLIEFFLACARDEDIIDPEKLIRRFDELGL
jgi:hypothetical protein